MKLTRGTLTEKKEYDTWTNIGSWYLRITKSTEKSRATLTIKTAQLGSTFEMQTQHLEALAILIEDYLGEDI